MRAKAAQQATALIGATVSVPPLKSVGCQGDARTYRNFGVICGDYGRDWDLLGDAATKIVNESGSLNRVCVSLLHNKAGDAPSFSVSPGGPHTCTSDRFDVLREADAIATQKLTDAGLMRKIWQCPVAMAPLTLNGEKGEVIILRPVDSTEAMTASFYRVPFEICDDIAAAIKTALPQIADVLFDVTNKPPGTIEWGAAHSRDRPFHNMAARASPIPASRPRAAFPAAHPARRPAAVQDGSVLFVWRKFLSQLGLSNPIRHRTATLSPWQAPRAAEAHCATRVEPVDRLSALVGHVCPLATSTARSPR